MELDHRFGRSLGPERVWLLTAAVALVALVGGSLVFRGTVWDGFLWHYFWGPVFADANNAACAVRGGGTTELLYSTAACEEAVAAGGNIVAEPGYTLVSEVGYAATLVFMLAGVLFLLRRLKVGRERGLLFALIPFMFFGGALRVVEDANDAVPQGVEPGIAYPLNSLIISPVIYFTVFAITLAALVLSVALARRDVVSRYEYPLAAIGSAVLVATVGYLVWFTTARLGPEHPSAGFYPLILLLTLILSTVIAGGLYLLYDRAAPAVTAGTGLMSFVVLFAHALDGVANVLAADWAELLGLPFSYSPKHPVNEFIINVTGAVLPPSVIDTIGRAWPFLLVKIVAATAVVYIFDETIFEENPRYAILLLVAIVAVGLGPGTRDMLRATFGI
ncbi:DUF63 family protein [Halomarina litorea]|uniref:DUF63 family protein n=1 Tax=Halomarina litorea TaxID=2961595 RepID=UPI0020C52DEC|nr:DUF63 family protein [Halomarina sp. BCD28]